MIWRLEAMSEGGLEGTVLGTLVMPYCSGIGNLIFAVVVAMKGGAGKELLTNALVNNVTNMTLLLGLPAIIWRMSVLAPEKAQKSSKKKKEKQQQVQKINSMSLFLTLTSVVFLTSIEWTLATDIQLS